MVFILSYRSLCTNHKMVTKMSRVIIVSPYRAEDHSTIKKHTKYARLCVKDSLERGEHPFASHIFYTQRGILDDENPAERNRGINAGYSWMAVADKVAIYTDLGMSRGMKQDAFKAAELKKEVEYRRILT